MNNPLQAWALPTGPCRMPPDVKLTPIDRHIAPPSSLVDEFVFEFTHSQPMDWMLPGELAVAQASLHAWYWRGACAAHVAGMLAARAAGCQGGDEQALPLVQRHCCLEGVSMPHILARCAAPSPAPLKQE